PLSAAQAGIDDYLLRLNKNGNYWQYGPTNAPPDGNKAFTQFVAIPGDANPGMFRYDADTTTIKVDGTIKITSTGRVNKVTRSVAATLRRRNFLDYLYFTDVEAKDPALYDDTVDNYDAAGASVTCATHGYNGPASACSLTN